jgi:glycerol-3-phosphate dehydrogenase
MTPPPARKDALNCLGSGTFDLLVIGGGIVGAGVARDAAMRGLSVALVEQNDFASGTSSRSSRLLHGGLRYLAQGRLRLVHEAGVEKMTRRRTAPHLTKPMPFVFPTYRGTEWKLWKLRIGVKWYDWLSAGRNFDKSGAFDRDETLAKVPGLRADGLTGAVRYFDAVTSDARLVIDTLRAAAHHGATALNYVSFDHADRRGGEWRGEVTDRLSNARVEFTARAVVNAAGAWADSIPQSRVKLRLTKGVHLVVPFERLPIPECVVMTEGPRILFAIPWGRRTILGTTDTDYRGDRDSPGIEPEDVRYILSVVNGSFPSAGLSDGDIAATWAGLRPLIASRSGKPSDISRAHQIRMTEPGWFDVAGGKLTTYRLMGEQTVDQVARFLNRAVAKSPTASQPLLPEGDVRCSGVVPPEVSREAVEQYCRNEWAVNVEDVMVRRSGWKYYLDDERRVASEVGNWMERFGAGRRTSDSHTPLPLPSPGGRGG